MDRRDFMTGSAAVLAAMGGGVTAASAQSHAVPEVSGPVTGGARGWPLGAFPRDLGRLGYVEEEYFISGRAAAYRPVGDLTPDGKWTVQRAGTRRYKTRLLVQKPRDPARFNGSVLVEWINVSPGHDNLIVPDEGICDGFAYVGVAAQYVGVHGLDHVPAAERQGLVQWDPQRYGSLSHPGDAYSFDIFTQVGRLLRNPGAGVNPLAGLTVRKVIGTGASQSAGRLRTYVNAFHPRDRAFDAYVPFLDFANATRLTNIRYSAASSEEVRAQFRFPAVYRDDLDVPVMVVNSEQEALDYRGPDRGFLLQPNNERFRLWEVAGAPHSADLPSDQVTRAAYGERDGLRRGGRPEGARPGSHVTSWDCTIAAYFHVHEWINGGAPPPMQPLLRFTEAAGPKLIRDEWGIGTGGIRLPEVEVPIELNTGLSDLPNQIRNRGVSDPFPAELVRQLYPTHENYVQKVTAAARAAQAAGVIRPYRADRYIADAQAAQVPPRA